MKKVIILFIALLYWGQGTAQINLEQAMPGPVFQDADVGSMAFGDIDNDGDNDLMVTGKGGPVLSTLYINDGAGNFTEATGAAFLGVFSGTVGFEDVNNDGFLDLLITGSTTGGIRTVNLYLNTGTGGFTLSQNTPFEPSSGGDFAFADVDNDGDKDVIMTGYDVNGNGFSTLYLNDGTGAFAEVTGTPFQGLKNGSVEFIDIENDGDEDVILAGLNNNDVLSTALFTNDGSGNFTLVPNTPFPGCDGGDIAIGDSDNDGDLDILLNGGTSNIGEITNLYINDGTGSFSLSANTVLPGTTVGVSEFADFDNDGDLDVIIIGAGDGVISNIYENQGANTFVLADELVAAYLASAAIGDIDGDNYIDVIIAGTSFSSPTRGTKTYMNQGMSTSEVNLFLEENQITIFPNPTQGSFKIEGLTGAYTIQILDMTGAMYQVLNTSSSSITLDITDLPAGMYLIRAESKANDRGSVQKILKQ